MVFDIIGHPVYGRTPLLSGMQAPQQQAQLVKAQGLLSTQVQAWPRLIPPTQPLPPSLASNHQDGINHPHARPNPGSK